MDPLTLNYLSLGNFRRKNEKVWKIWRKNRGKDVNEIKNESKR